MICASGSNMSTQKSTFFAIPTAFIEELRQVRYEWGQAVKQRRDDDDVIMNRLYRRADEVAVDRASIVHEESSSALVGVMHYIEKKAWHCQFKDIVAPDDCLPFKQGIDALEARLGGEERLLYQVARHCPESWPVDQYPLVYRNLRTVLDQAIARKAGLAWFSYDQNAEAELVEHRAEQARPKPPLPPRLERTPEEYAHHVAAIRAEMQARDDRFDALAQENARIRNPKVRHHEQLSYYAVPVSIMDDLRALHRACTHTSADYHWDPSTTSSPSENLHYRAWDEASAEIEVRELGHRSALQQLERRIVEFRPAAVQESGLYDREQVRVLANAIDAWIAHVGDQDAAIDDITASAYGNSRDHTEYVVEELRHLLVHAIEGDRGLARVIHTP